MEPMRIIAQWHRLFHYFGPDEGDSEPYLWTIAIVFDGSTITHQPNAPTLSGVPTCHFSPGSHGNIGGPAGLGVALTIPPAVGRFETTLQPIELNLLGQTFAVPGVVVLMAVLLEENAMTNDQAEVGHRAMNDFVQAQLAQFLAGLQVADIIVAAEQAKAQGEDPASAITMLFSAQLKTIKESAGPVVKQAIKDYASGLSALFAWVDSDDRLGVAVNYFTATELEPLRHDNRTELLELFHDSPDAAPLESGTYAFNMQGEIWRPVAITYTPVTEDVPPGRWRVTGTQDGYVFGTHKRFTQGIGGSFPDGTPWRLDAGRAMQLIRGGTHTFYVQGDSGVPADLQIVPNEDNPYFPYLGTVPDNDPTNNLSRLPAAVTQTRHVQNVPA
jgi:hypothetical protein